MTERPILFSSEMVRAILEGRKTQTRRVMKEPWHVKIENTVHGDGPWIKTFVRPGIYPVQHNRFGAISVTAEDGDLLGIKPAEFEWACPYGVPGDRLWVREKLKIGQGRSVVYFDTLSRWAQDMPWKPSIFMPRWASRITLEITNIRVQRVQEISEEDCKAEGMENYSSISNPLDGFRIMNSKSLFFEIWNSINAKRGFGWDVDPWVWVIEFKKVEEK